MLRLVAQVRRAGLGIRRMSALSKVLDVQDIVQDAIANGKPVVALESTIVAHGMPFPQNLELAMEVEDILRRKVSIVGFF
jgi:pseudouridine-5'-phosphate glycosidase